ncbi:transcriptional regulator [Streptomyces oceani]|uniref:Transcriptional regulator n=1 Tax=Streptomyces oceani TaxID=1075402 RepID=A0A1E7JWJ9_9ACTN|nr:transcriptional regulator [Streptomyces oceani]
MVRLTHLVQRVFDDASRHHDLTPQQAQLLCRLVDGPVGMTELGRMLHLEKSSVTGLVDRVELRGLITRARSTEDRRAWYVALTEQGERVAVDTHHEVIAQLEKLVGDISTSDRERLISLIAGIIGPQPS